MTPCTPVPPPPGSLWRDRQFLKLWTGGAISQLGDAVTALALPLTAVAVLGATPAQMGLLGAAGTVPHLLLGLFVGVWVDRLRRRPVMVAAQLGQAAVLGSIPVAAALDILSIGQLYLTAFLVGALGVFSGAASFSVVPALVGRARIVEANAKIALYSSVAAIAGPGLAGWLVQLLNAPRAILIDALSFQAAALCWGLLRVQEPSRPRPERQSMPAEIGEGLRAVYGDPVLRASTAVGVLGLLALSVQQPVLVLYLTRDVGLTPALIGAAFAAGGIASVLGAMLAAPSARRFGAGRAMALGNLLTALGMLLLPLVGGPLWLALALLVAARGLLDLGSPIYVTNQISLRQLVTPDHLLGRVNATRRFLVVGLAPLGALLGGALGEQAGPRPTLLAGGAIMLVALLWLVRSPVWREWHVGESAEPVPAAR